MSAQETLDSMGIATFRADDGTIMVQPIDSKLLDYSDARPASAEEAALHERAVYDSLMEEAEAGLI